MNTKYFLELEQKLKDFQNEIEVIVNEKNKLLYNNEFNPEIKKKVYELQERQDKLICPLTGGQAKALYDCLSSMRSDTPVICTEIFWRDEAVEYAKTLLDGDVDDFFYMNSSSGLMDTIYNFTHSGFRIVECCIVDTGDTYKPERNKAIHFSKDYFN